MNYSLLVLSSPLAGQAARNAAKFAQALIARGHHLRRVFFLDDGAYAGGNLPVFPQDEADRLEPWVKLAEEYGVELSLCISSALRRGMLDEGESERHEKTGASIHDAFVESCRADGMPVLIVTHDVEQAARLCDRVLRMRGGRLENGE